MIEQFIDSWVLFSHTYLAGWLIALTLSLVGILVVLRDQVFLGAAVSQASTFGVAIAFWAGGSFALETAWESGWFITAMAVAFSIVASVITSRGGRGRESHEAITGWIFLISAAGAPLVVAHSPHGLEEIHKLLSSSIIGVTAVDVWTFGALFVLAVLALVFAHKAILLLIVDEEMAGSVGMKTSLVSAAAYIVLGLAIGLSIRAAGLLYTFGMLVLPALVAKNLSRRLHPMLFIAPAVALLASLLGFMLANFYDLPPAQVAVLLLGLGLLPAWAVRRVRS